MEKTSVEMRAVLDSMVVAAMDKAAFTCTNPANLINAMADATATVIGAVLNEGPLYLRQFLKQTLKEEGVCVSNNISQTMEGHTQITNEIIADAKAVMIINAAKNNMAIVL